VQKKHLQLIGPENSFTDSYSFWFFSFLFVDFHLPAWWHRLCSLHFLINLSVGLPLMCLFILLPWPTSKDGFFSSHTYCCNSFLFWSFLSYCVCNYLVGIAAFQSSISFCCYLGFSYQNKIYLLLIFLKFRKHCASQIRFFLPMHIYYFFLLHLHTIRIQVHSSVVLSFWVSWWIS